MDINIRELAIEDRDWVKALFEEHWGGDCIVSKGKVHKADELLGFIAEWNGERVGLLTYNIEDGNLEITSLNSLRENQGIGGDLVERVVGLARKGKLRRVWLVTTNDNLNAFRFYQKRKFRIIAVHLDGVAAARKVKPGIPMVGENGIPLQDELEFSITL